MANIIDLFAGAGGLSLGASRAGFNVVSAVEIDSPALLMRSRTYVPVRFISNALGVKVDWDNEKKIVYLVSE